MYICLVYVGQIKSSQRHQYVGCNLACMTVVISKAPTDVLQGPGQVGLCQLPTVKMAFVPLRITQSRLILVLIIFNVC